MPSKLPKPNTHKERQVIARVVPPIFRLGDESKNKDILYRNERLLIWNTAPGDEEIGPIAGWQGFLKKAHLAGGVLELPAGTRNARSLLSGKEAWEGEKFSVIQRVEQYYSDMYKKIGAYVVDFSWNQVGITPTQDIFIAPPNKRTTSLSDAQHSYHATVEELAELLQNDTTNQALVAGFEHSLAEVFDA